MTLIESYSEDSHVWNPAGDYSAKKPTERFSTFALDYLYGRLKIATSPERNVASGGSLPQEPMCWPDTNRLALACRRAEPHR